jgi:hypothetical protein
VRFGVTLGRLNDRLVGSRRLGPLETTLAPRQAQNLLAYPSPSKNRVICPKVELDDNDSDSVIRCTHAGLPPTSEAQMALSQRALGISILALLCYCSTHALAQCSQTTFSPDRTNLGPPVTHQAYSLTDPSLQQTAVFDLYWGGALASLKYNNTETIWGNDPGGMVQPAWFAYPHGAPPHPGYDPEQAGGNDYAEGGDPSLSSPTFGASCLDSHTLLIIGGTTDYFSAEAGYRDTTYTGPNNGYKVGNPVINGAISSQAFTTPYTITQIATFVANPGLTPAYYLKIQQTIFNNHPTELLPFGAGVALYVPPAFTNSQFYPANCIYNPKTQIGAFCAIRNADGTVAVPRFIAGLYSTPGLTFGTAIFVRPTDWLGATMTGTFGASGSSLNWSTGAGANYWVIAPTTSQTFQFYVMVGAWTPALTFANGN